LNFIVLLAPLWFQLLNWVERVATMRWIMTLLVTLEKLGLSTPSPCLCAALPLSVLFARVLERFIPSFLSLELIILTGKEDMDVRLMPTV
jgi:hypothetical protein